MSLSALPPVRRAVPLRRARAAPDRKLAQFFPGRRVELYASGTAALSRAIAECAARSTADSPEVILPAYGCPDLVAACVHASVHPRLVDVAATDWRYDPDGLGRSISRATVAIVAVNLLGVGDDAALLRQVGAAHGIPLIQDSAQFLPRVAPEWTGDYVILSFGRGKPMNLLHGGALIGPGDSRNRPPILPARYPVGARLRASRMAALAFNALTRPHVFGLVSRLPGTGLGEVVYKPLLEGAPLPARAWRQVDSALGPYCLRQSYSRAIWQDAIDDWRRFGIVPLECSTAAPCAEPLRLGLLAPSRAVRDELVGRLHGHGLGASPFYGSSLDRLPGIPDAVRQQGPFPNATRLADRLFTLPTHRLVTPDNVLCAREVISNQLRAHVADRPERH